ncbi:SPW repeat protein [Streptosporangium lutulentum]|uniref:SPW repeat-containing integral membrane domain-containing protein n=1 Tax=Streptosporangium lutulentum TaxID=1461250 RepID=A0ABT9QM62_9ACTN|nr:SPW repeat protein [Streptosporangium lutulentum]MDP9847846.1 hypothetical protein [Streptosporangium lutulentum]
MAERSLLDMDQHPDITALRARYDLAAEMPFAQVVSGLTFLGGLYLAISPWVVGFDGRTTLTVNNLITGIAVALLAVGFASAYSRTHGVTWVIPFIGLWTIIAPWVLPGHGATTSVAVNNPVVGFVIILCGLAGIGIGMMSLRRR